MGSAGHVGNYRRTQVEPCESGSNGAGHGRSSPPIALLFALVLCGLGAVEFHTLHEYHVKSAIQRHGARQEASVLDLYERVRHHVKTGDQCDVFAAVQFTPQGRASPVTETVRLAGCHENSPAVGHAMQHQTLPLAYDTTDPSTVHLNFDDEVFREDTRRTLKVHLLVLATFGALGVAVLVAISLLRRR